MTIDPVTQWLAEDEGTKWRSKPTLRYRLKKPFRRLREGWKFARCDHDYESHSSKDEPGTCVYLCLRCGSGWKVT